MMGFWDSVVRFRENFLRDRPTPSNKAALKATKYIRGVLEPNWNEQDSARHYLTSRFRVAYLPYDLWLDQFARKLKAMKKIDGTEDILRRLASLDQYAGARFEMETGLALSLGGFDVRFIRADQTGPSADILARFDSQEFVVEVTTLNRSQNETRAMELSKKP
jgi:hypothetical protein